MANEDDVDDRLPLLNCQDQQIEVPTPRQKIKSLYESAEVLGRHSPYTGREDDNINISASSSIQNLSSPENDQIVAIFVVSFDTKAGNVVEWCLPEDINLEGVEFKAMASGSHTLVKDFVYFRQGGHYGLACFENMSVDIASERGARMRSVGILATSYTLLYRHMNFLERQVRHQLETPRQYERLAAFWQDKKAVLPTTDSHLSLAVQPTGHTASSTDISLQLKVTHPAGCFDQFLKFFGEKIFAIWRFALLGKRILFFSPPPIGIVCYRVYCACCLANHSLHRSLSSEATKPHFYVNVANIDELETEVSYIACTTEKIFEIKRHLYDLYVDNQVVTTTSDGLNDLLQISSGDREKLQTLTNQRLDQQFSKEEYGDSDVDDELIFTSFFTEQNNRLLQTLVDVSASQDRQLTGEHMKAMGLDPLTDRTFLMELVELHGIDVMLMVDNPCCPR